MANFIVAVFTFIIFTSGLYTLVAFVTWDFYWYNSIDSIYIRLGIIAIFLYILGMVHSSDN